MEWNLLFGIFYLVPVLFGSTLPLTDIFLLQSRSVTLTPRAGSVVERMDPLRFLAGCHTSRLNQALSDMSLLKPSFFLRVSIVLLTKAIFCVELFGVICVFCLLVVLVRLSVPVQVTDWKDSSPK